MTLARVAVRGGGVAAAVAVRLLRAARIEAAVSGEARSSVPAMLLSDPARALLRDALDAPGLFEGLSRVERRVVDWGGEQRAMPHGASILGAEMLRSIEPAERGVTGAGDFTIDTASGREMRRFGERQAASHRVRLRGGESGTCWVEAVASGWLFLMPAVPPCSRGGGNPEPHKPINDCVTGPRLPPARQHDQGCWLLAVGDAPDILLSQSRTVAPLIDTLNNGRSFDAAPRMAAQLADPDRLACGSAALGFDPVCGDGVAQSAREGILAAAVVAAIAEGGDATALIGHYEAMLIAAMRRHLQLSMPFYATGGTSDWWRAQHEALVEGHAYCTRLLARRPEPRFMLDGFRLVPRAVAA